MYHFCTYFDYGYLRRALALYRSLRRHCRSFQLFVLCMDEACYEALAALALPEVVLIPLAQLEHGDEALLRAKGNRSRIEYYFTCTPSLPRYILAHWPEVELVTYLDADLYFFADPRPLFDAIGDGTVAVVPHRFTPRLRRLERLGRYNVGWVSFRRGTAGQACLEWWRERCLEWCYDRYEPTRFADQKYLDEWPARFASVVELPHKGANLAPWNLANYRISARGEAVHVDEEPLYFYHFHAFRQPEPERYDHRLHLYKTRPTAEALRLIYVPYIHALAAEEQDRGLVRSHRRLGNIARLLAQPGDMTDLGLGMLTRRFIEARRGRLVAYDRLWRPIDLGPQPKE